MFEVERKHECLVPVFISCLGNCHVNVRNFSLALVSLVLAIVAMSAGSVVAQGDFFFTFAPGGANADNTGTFDVGDTGSLIVYWSTNGPNDSDLDVGAFIDVTSSTAGVIEFTAAETFDFEIQVGGQVVGNRIADVNGGGGSFGPADSVTADFVDELSAFTVVGGPGIIEANNGSGVFLDTGYNASNDGFEWAIIDFNVIGTGSTDIIGTAGDGLIVNGGDEVPAVFTTATVNVNGGNGPTVPEPTTASLLVLGLAGIAARRRR